MELLHRIVTIMQYSNEFMTVLGPNGYKKTLFYRENYDIQIICFTFVG